jgi:hypothetical protein
MTELVEDETEEVVIVNVALLAAAGTTTLPGTCAAAVLELVRVTVAPPPNAGPLNLSVHCEVLPPNTLVGFTVTDATVGVAEIVSVRFAVCVRAGLLESATLKVSGVLATDAEGVPVMAPVETFRVKPAGREPLVSDQVYGEAPPVAVRVALYATAVCPLGKDEVEMTSAAAETVRVREALCVRAGLLESETLNVSGVLATDAEGVPVMAPVETFRVKPAGREPPVSDQVYGETPPVAVRVALYATPVCPLGKDEVEMTSAAAETVRVREALCVRAGLLESATLNVSGVLATNAEGVPVMAPVEAFSVRPAGREPLVSDQVYGDTPPVAVRVAL